MSQPFDFPGRVTEHDQCLAASFIGSLYRPPDLVIAPEGHGEYLFRWFVTPHSKEANVYFHVQTASDPERPLHDHPWDNTSVILAGGYQEIVNEHPINYPHDAMAQAYARLRHPGDVIHRPATWAHRLILPPEIPYTMSLFTTGPKVRDWGFYMPGGWVSFEEVTRTENGKSIWKDKT